jgi:L-histidine N-alpha-methyltransferase
MRDREDVVTGPARFTLLEVASAGPRAAFARDVRAGLLARPKRLPCCYFYDAEGSRLFEEICELPEYYLTRAEREILEARAQDVASRFPAAVTLVELGSGSADKTRLLIDALLRQHGALRYVPVDICRPVLEASARALLHDYPAIEVHAIAGDYHDALRHLAQEAGRPKLILWLGSSIGNLDRPDAAGFLRRVRETMAGEDRLLVGIDLRKARRVLEPAYDDARGVTARFNRNLLARINRELGGRFDPDSFLHRAVYDEARGRIEMYLVSPRAQRVRIDALDLVVPFDAGEAIHTENSYKYSLEEIAALAQDAGLALERRWLDASGRFSLSLCARAGREPQAPAAGEPGRT